MLAKDEDIRLRRDVLAELELDPAVDARLIGVAVEEGVVALTGHVGSYTSRANAEAVARRVPGVKGVANDLEVKPPASVDRDDVDIALAATHVLGRKLALPVGRVQVTVTEGWVMLDGSVEWQSQKRAAEDAVFLLAGVRGVTNRLRVGGRG
jgi:osmotically-inducible protein OsmY